MTDQWSFPKRFQVEQKKDAVDLSRFRSALKAEIGIKNAEPTNQWQKNQRRCQKGGIIRNQDRLGANANPNRSKKISIDAAPRIRNPLGFGKQFIHFF